VPDVGLGAAGVLTALAGLLDQAGITQLSDPGTDRENREAQKTGHFVSGAVLAERLQDLVPNGVFALWL
jgi:hypothetical protein